MINPYRARTFMFWETQLVLAKREEHRLYDKWTKALAKRWSKESLQSHAERVMRARARYYQALAYLNAVTDVYRGIVQALNISAMNMVEAANMESGRRFLYESEDDDK